MTVILRCRFTVGRLGQTLLKYIFSESLIIVHYDGLFTNVKKKIRFPKYSPLFLEVQRLTNQVRFRLDLSGRRRQTLMNCASKSVAMALALLAVEEIELKRQAALVGCKETFWILSVVD